MRRLLLALLTFLAGLNISSAQTPTSQQPARFSLSLSPYAAEDDNTLVVLTFTADIDSGWHIYATSPCDDPFAGPFPTSVAFDELLDCQAIGSLTSSGSVVEAFDDMFGCIVRYHRGHVVFQQLLSTSSSDFRMRGSLQYVACSSELCTAPESVEFSLTAADLSQADVNNVTSNVKGADEDIAGIVKGADEDFVSRIKKLLIIFLGCFAGGLIALVTPCVWPILIVTISFFIKRAASAQQSQRDALIYGLSIVAIYLLVGLVVAFFFGASAPNVIATSAVLNIFFTLLLLAFGLSFMGAFELTLPSSWTTATDAAARRLTGLPSLFMMAATLVIASFSCTATISGFLLVQVAAEAAFTAPLVGMFGFSLALALPFSLCALFPKLLNRLPRSGGWMNTLKVTLGFVELAFALKFFSVADMAYNWQLLSREAFIALWAALSFALSLYLFGIVRLHHDDDNQRIGALRTLLATIALAFALYMTSGLLGAPLKAVSAFVPVSVDASRNAPRTTSQLNHSLDLDEALAEARRTKRQVLVEFTGYGCVNCRKMEQNVLADPRVGQRIAEDYIFVSLYVDDRTPLPDIQQVTTRAGSQKTLRTVGDKWSHLQQERYGVNAQPYYLILDTTSIPISAPYTFDDNVDHFLTFLQQNSK